MGTDPTRVKLENGWAGDVTVTREGNKVTFEGEITGQRTLTLNRHSLLLRFYAWLYGVDPAAATFCSLFWGILLAPIALPLKPFGLASLAMIEGVADRLERRSLLKEERTGKTWKQRHPRLDGWLEHPSKVGRLLPLGLTAVAFTIYDSLTHPWMLAWYLPFVAFLGWLILHSAKRKPLNRAERVFLTGYRSLKYRTCPRIEVK